MNYLMQIAYDGSDYFGFSRQKNVSSIQQTIETVLSKLTNEPIKIIGSGRTDRGVHALKQVINFKTKANYLTINKIKDFCNKHLPHNILVLKVKKVNDHFHAQHDVKIKTYQYIINNLNDNVFQRQYCWYVKPKLSLKKLKEAASIFVGTHDFSSYANSDLNDNVRTVFKINVTQIKGVIKITISGNGFLRCMVRYLVGSMVGYSLNKVSLNQLKKWLNFPLKGQATFKAIPNGLYLYNVKY